jgi:hypothetical protein
MLYFDQFPLIDSHRSSFKANTVYHHYLTSIWTINRTNTVYFMDCLKNPDKFPLIFFVNRKVNGNIKSKLEEVCLLLDNMDRFMLGIKALLYNYSIKYPLSDRKKLDLLCKNLDTLSLDQIESIIKNNFEGHVCDTIKYYKELFNLTITDSDSISLHLLLSIVKNNCVQINNLMIAVDSLVNRECAIAIEWFTELVNDYRLRVATKIKIKNLAKFAVNNSGKSYHLKLGCVGMMRTNANYCLVTQRLGNFIDTCFYYLNSIYDFDCMRSTIYIKNINSL